VCDHSWLPPEMPFRDDGRGWPAYWDDLYEVFCDGLVRSTPTLFDMPVHVPKKLGDDGKHERFTHIATGNYKLDPRNDREIKLGRCATVPWVRPIIDAASGGRGIRGWREWYQREREFRWLLALEEFCHLVVLVERATSLYLITAYPVEYEDQRKSLRRRFEDATRAPRKS
jgi:hypothetical protein